MGQDLSELTEQYRQMVQGMDRFRGTLKLDMGDHGVIYVDGSSSNPIVNNDRKDAQCSIELSPATLEDMLNGSLHPMQAYRRGVLKVTGELGILNNLVPLFPHE